MGSLPYPVVNAKSLEKHLLIFLQNFTYSISLMYTEVLNVVNHLFIEEL